MFATATPQATAMASVRPGPGAAAGRTSAWLIDTVLFQERLGRLI